MKDEVWEEWKSFYPQFGRVLPSGHLRVPFAQRLASGELVDGHVELTPEHPHYSEWLEVITEGTRKQRKRNKSSSQQN